MEEFVVEVNHTLKFQTIGQKLQYKPENLFIRDIAVGVRAKEDDWIAYIECKIWNIASQKDLTFWNYANECEKEMSKKSFLAICNYLKVKNTPKKSIWSKKQMSGWVVYLSEFTVYDTHIQWDCDKLQTAILEALPTMLQHSFFIKPAYIFADISANQVEQMISLEAAEFKKLGTLHTGEIVLFMRVCR